MRLKSTEEYNYIAVHSIKYYKATHKIRKLNMIPYLGKSSHFDSRNKPLLNSKN